MLLSKYNENNVYSGIFNYALNLVSYYSKNKAACLILLSIKLNNKVIKISIFISEICIASEERSRCM